MQGHILSPNGDALIVYKYETITNVEGKALRASPTMGHKWFYNNNIMLPGRNGIKTTPQQSIVAINKL